MATSNKAQDPEAAALSAIEEALNLAANREAAGESPKERELSTPIFPKASDPDKTPKLKRRQGEPTLGGSAGDARPAPRLPEVEDQGLFAKRSDKRSDPAERRRGADPSLPPLGGEPLTPSGMPANDDRSSMGSVLRALNKRPSRVPQILSFVFSAVWLALAGVYFAANWSTMAGQGGFLANPTTPLYLMLAAGPVLFFIITAIVIRRAQEIRITARSLAEIAMRLAEPETVAADQMVTLSQAIRREIVSMGDGIERALSRAGELETLVRSEVTNLERSYSENERRMKALVDSLSDGRENMLNNAERMRDTITSVQESFARDIDVASARLAEGLGEAASRVTTSLGAKGEEIRLALGHTGEEVVANLLLRGEDIIGRLEQTQQTVGQSLTETGSAITHGLEQRVSELDTNLRTAGEAMIANFVEQLDHAGNRIGATLDDGGGRITARLGEASDRLSATLSETLSTLTAQSDQMNERLSLTAQETLSALVNHIETMQETVGNAAQQTLDTFTYHAGSLNDRFAETVGEAVTAIATHSDRVSETLSQRIARFEETVIGHGTQVADKIANEAGQIAASLTNQFETVESTLTQRSAEIELRSVQATEAVELQLRAFEERTAAATFETTSSLDKLLDRIDAGLDERAKALNETLAARTLEIAQQLGDGGREITHVLEARIVEVEQLLASRTTALTDTLSSKAAELNLALGGRALEIAETFSARADEVNQVLGGRSLEIAETLDDRINRFEEHVVSRLDTISTDLDVRGRNVAESLISCATEIDATLSQHAAHLTQVLDHESGQLSEVLGGRTETLRELLGQAAEDLDTTLAARANEIGAVLAGRVNEIGSTLANRLGELQTSLEDRGESLRSMLDEKGTNLVEQLGDKQRELRAVIELSSTELRAAIETGAEASVNSLVDVNSRLASEIASVLGQIDDRNDQLQAIIANAGATFSAIENALSAGVRDFERAISDITKEVQGVGANADSTIASARALYENITRQQQALASAAGELARSQAELDRTLDERRASLQALLNSVESRRTDLDEVMQAFAAAIEGSFERVETRAREVGTFMAEASQATTGLVERQFGEIRAAMGSERTHTASLLRAAYEQANAEIDQIFTTSTERFQSAAVEMRNLAREVQRELETTREELRRNAVNLPQETAEQAAVMRRVVADQIKALNELTDVVARSGRAFDLSDPMTMPARVVDAVPAGRRIEPMRQDHVRYAESLATAEPSRPEPPRPRPAPPAPRPAPAAPAERSGAGWLSDLLARASRDEGQGPRPNGAARGQGEPLDMISQDIARMIDHAALADAWDRYRRGESGAFSRQLYVGRGLQTYEDIRRRYRADADFRTTVDRYIQEFERLLADVNRDDRDDNLTKTYLTSETGKVYTMLAHAAGRLS